MYVRLLSYYATDITRMRTRTLVNPWTLGHLMGSDEILGRAPTQSPQIPRG